MKILFVSVGKPHDGMFREAVEEFSLRISRSHALDWRFVSSSKKAGDAGKKEEAAAIEKILSAGDFLVSLDERGKTLSSPEFADFFQKRMNDGAKRVVFVIGGSYGIHESLLEKSNSVLSLSRLTFPHQLARLILAEQVYRAFSIIKGEKYHHE